MAVAIVVLLGWPLDPLADHVTPTGSVVVDASGIPLQRDARQGLRLRIPSTDLPPIVVAATIAAEDRRYYLHPGVDPIAIARAAIRRRSQPSGASTITQQVARMAYLRDEPPGLGRKIREAWIALRLQVRSPKQEVLAFYLNESYYGHGAYGIEAAARTYFGVGAHGLDLAQASMLAGLPQSPRAYDPLVHLGAARERQRYVLDRMVATRRATNEDAREAAAEELVLLTEPANPIAPHFVQYVLAELEQIRPGLASERGLRVETTLDAALQGEAERIARAHLQTIADRQARDAAVVVLDPRSGAMLAMVGSPDFSEPRLGQVNLALSPHQTGSTLKPFVYVAALEHGYTAATPVLDVATAFETEGGLYQPLDNDFRFRGPVPIRVALASSLNIPAVRTLAEVGPAAVLDVASRVGLAPQESLRDAGLGMALGTAEVPLLDLVSAYGVFGSRGNWVPPFAVQRVIDARGRVVYEHSGTEPHRAISEEHAFIIADILSDPEARMTGFGSDTSRLSTAARSAVKTGTTTGGRDVWAVGFTSTRSVGVWVGNADGGPTIDLTSVRGAAPIWRAVMDMATTGQSTSWLARPAALVSARVCGATGLAPGDACPAPYDEWFVKGSEPAGTESSYRIAGAGGVTQDVPTEAGSWAAGLSGNRITTSSGVLVAAPVNGSVLYRAPELAAQAVLLRAVVPTSASRVSFYLDGGLVGTTTADVPYVTTSIVVGHHELEVRVAMPNGEQSAWSAFRVEDR